MNRGLGLVAVLTLGAVWVTKGDAPLVALSAQEATATPAQKTPELGVGQRLFDAFLQDQPASHLSILVATVPDPRASHLDWAFDSHVDALRRAFERAGFVLDRFELPWSKPVTGTPKLPGVPGAMLFRERARPVTPGGEVDPLQRKLWLVYLIGELSTEGIDKLALKQVLDERSKLTPGAPDLRIVGPVFSGSSPSLRIALASAQSLAGTEHVYIVSGSATSPHNLSILTFGTNPAVTFESTLHTDDTLLDVLKENLLPKLGLEEGEVAVFQESTTDYGQSTLAEVEPVKSGSQTGETASVAGEQAEKKKAGGFVVVPFPMSIASLRNAYFKTNKTQATPSGPVKTANANVVLDLGAEPERAETTGSSSLLSPASIDLLLDEMARMLAQRGIRAVLLLASDVRDKLFLGSEIKKRLPDLQLFTFEGNVLYLRPEYNRWMRAMVVLSTYPLLLRDASWRAQSSTSFEQVLFSNEGAEGTFNAVLVQLELPKLLTDYCPPLQDAPKESDKLLPEAPPVWATLVGAGTMLPLGAFAAGKAEPRTPIPKESSIPNRGAGRSLKGRNFLVVASVSILSFFLLGKVVLRWVRRRHKRDLRDRILAIAAPNPRASWEERDASLHSISLAIHHELYVSLMCVALIGLILPHVVLLVVSPGPKLDSRLLPILLGSLAVLAGLVEVCISAFNALSTAHEHRKFAFAHLRSKWPVEAGPRFFGKVEIALRALVGIFGIAYLVVHVWFCAQMWWSSHATAHDLTLFRLFVHRAIDVDQGISPLVPLLLIGIAVLVWCQWHILRIRGLAHVEVGETAWAALSEDIRLRTADLRERLFRVVPDLPAFGLLGILVVGFAWMFFQVETTLDGFVQKAQGQVRVFDFVLAAGIVAALAASTWAAYRLLAVWKSFALLLRHSGPALADLPFTDVRKSLGVRASVGLWPAMKHADFISVARGAWERLGERAKVHPEVLHPLCSREALSAWATARGREDLLQASPETGRALSAWMKSGSAPEPQGDDGNKHFKAQQELAAVESLVYVEWVLGHIRRLCFFLLLSVVLTTLLISSYPFQPQALFQTISLFIFAGVVACLVSVIGAMNRNAGLSRLSGSTPGELTWDRTLYANLALYLIVPAITLISSQNTLLRETLFKWVEPLVKFVVSA